MKAVGIILAQWRLLLAALVAAAIVHIWTTLSAMDQPIMPGYATIVRNLPVNKITYLDPITPETQPLPFMMPDSLYAICRFDASTASIQLTASLPEAGWSLSLHAPNGDNFYFVPGTDARVTKLDLVLQPAGAAYLTAPGSQIARGVERPKVHLPVAEGIAILRAPIKGLAYRRLTDEMRSVFGCSPISDAIASR